MFAAQYGRRTWFQGSKWYAHLDTPPSGARLGRTAQKMGLHNAIGVLNSCRGAESTR
jgi:hypothetical protein